jgi:predicted Zn-dependent protease
LTLQGRYFDGKHPIGAAATLSVMGPEAVLSAAAMTRRWPAGELRVSPRVGHADRFIRLPDGGQFQCPDAAVLDALGQEVRSEGAVAWLEDRVAVAVLCIAVIAAVVVVGYLYGLPRAAELVAARIPIESERALGRQALDWLDEHKWFATTKVDAERQAAIRGGFAELIRDSPVESSYQLEFRAGDRIGPNAFALPGGFIVVTDPLVELAQSDDEVVAILAHEVGHVEHRHTMRHILQSSVAGVVAAVVTADAASLGVAVTGLPIVVARASYSRQFETEADDFAFRRLKETGRSPDTFAAIMERLSGERPQGVNFLSTHPITADRIARARAASASPP